MVNQSLVSYIQQTQKQGYTLAQIKDYLIKSGYPPADVNEAVLYVDNLSKPKSPILPKKIIIISAAVLAVIILVAAIFILSGGEETPAKDENIPPDISLSIELVTDTISAGQPLSFHINTKNSGGGTAQINIENQILDQYGDIKASKSDFFYVSDNKRTSYFITVPSTLNPGSYVLRSTAKYNNLETKESVNFSITGKTQTQTESESSCFDNIKNQGETNIDCGGPCQDCSTQPSTGCGNCNDGDLCTTDSCTDGKCVNTQIKPCCGNNLCEVGEDYHSCRADCQPPPDILTEDMTAKEVTEAVKDVAKSDPNEAGKMCEELIEERDQDICFSNIAESIKAKDFCSYVVNVQRRDNCYMNNFALDGDYSVCTSLTSSYMKRACGQLQKLESIAAQNPT